MHSPPKYRAPALERGLEIVELLASASGPMDLTDICQGLNRRPGQLFRLLQVLENRRFITRRGATRAYALTNKIFHLATAQNANRSFPGSVIPLMRDLSDRVSHSCHLSVVSDDEAVVIVHIDSVRDLALTVALGFRRHIAEVPAGVVLFAFQPHEMRLQWLNRLKIENDAKTVLVLRAERARLSGYMEENSSFAPGITELCAPVMQQGRAIAAVTIPFVQTHAPTLSREQAVLELCKAACKMSDMAEGG
jgi:DNA-binding IclR family transcriptional regulator